MIELLRTVDIGEIQQLHKAIFSEEFPLEEFNRKTETRDLMSYVFMKENTRVGYVIVSNQKEKQNLHLWLGGIIPSLQGKGYFGQVLDQLKKMVRNSHYQSVTLSSYNHRPHMMRLAIKKGFKIISTEEGKYGDKIKIQFKHTILPQQELRIGLTNTCNFDCFFCHNEGLESSKALTLSEEKLEKILNQANQNQVEAITFTGGEPTINRKAIQFVIHYCNTFKEKPNITIVTNGSLMDLDFIAMLKSYKGKININLSFHSIDKYTFNRVTQTNLYFEKVLKCMDLFQQEGIHFRLNYVVLKDLNDNETSFKRLVSECLDRKIKKITFLELLVTEESKEMVPYFVDYENIKKIIDSSLNQMGKLNIEYENNRKIRYSLTTETQTLFLEVLKLSCKLGCENCHAIKDRVIGPNGEYYPCFIKQDKACNVLEDMEGAFKEGDKVIAAYAKRYGKNSPILT